LTAENRRPSLVSCRNTGASVTLIRSLLYCLYLAVGTFAFFLWALPLLVLPRIMMVRTSQAWSRTMFWGLKVFAGCDWEIRGEIPRQPVLVAAKHMSMWDTMALYALLDDVCIVVKKELLVVPFYGWYIGRAGVIGIDRSAGARALRQMAAEAKPMIAAGRPVAIFPEGTRKKPSATPDYKPGVAGLYTQLGVPCVPVALNSGLFWTGFIKRPGKIVIEFLPPIPAGLTRSAFMRELETRIETATAKLVEEGRHILAGHG
jgi:1-acyl-sn-glycerol-3-phosphate acyltransferase